MKVFIKKKNFPNLRATHFEYLSYLMKEKKLNFELSKQLV